MHGDGRDASRAAWIAGRRSATRIPMIAMTTNTSTSVKPRFDCIFFPIKKTVENRFELREELLRCENLRQSKQHVAQIQAKHRGSPTAVDIYLKLRYT